MDLIDDPRRSTMAQPGYKVILASTPQEAHAYAQEQGWGVREYRFAARAATIRGLKMAEVHELPGFRRRLDRHAIEAELRLAKTERIKVGDDAAGTPVNPITHQINEPAAAPRPGILHVIPDGIAPPNTAIVGSFTDPDEPAAEVLTYTDITGAERILADAPATVDEVGDALEGQAADIAWPTEDKAPKNPEPKPQRKRASQPVKPKAEEPSPWDFGDTPAVLSQGTIDPVDLEALGV